MRLIFGRLSHFRPLLEEAVTAVESAYPSIPEEIYEQLQICTKTGIAEMRQIESSGAKALSPSGYEDGENHRQKLTEAYLLAAKLVRERLRGLSEI